jgi:hypothetical protein
MRKWILVLALIVSVVGLPMTAPVGAMASVPDTDLSCSFYESSGSHIYQFDCRLTDLGEIPGEDFSWQNVEIALDGMIDAYCRGRDGMARPEGYIIDLSTENVPAQSGNLLAYDMLIYGVFACTYWSM